MLDNLFLQIQIWIRRLLIHINIIPPVVIDSSYINKHPAHDDLKDNKILIVRNGNILKWACLSCPGGCGEKIMLGLSPQRRPNWTFKHDILGRISLYPSVWQKNECGCHFWIQNGRVKWCKGGIPLKQHSRSKNEISVKA